MTKQTDAQWASTEVQNRRDRDRRRQLRKTDPGFRAAEAQHSAAYRLRNHAPLIQGLYCSRCNRFWHRVRRSSSTPKTCPMCRKQVAASDKRLRDARKADGVCVRCTDSVKPGRTLCCGCGGDASKWQRDKRSRREQHFVCVECGQVWSRCSRGGGRPNRCPECR